MHACYLTGVHDCYFGIHASITLGDNALACTRWQHSILLHIYSQGYNGGYKDIKYDMIYPSG